jgi:hypothetical protein
VVVFSLLQLLAGGIEESPISCKRSEAVHLEQVGAALAEHGDGLPERPVEGVGDEVNEVLPAAGLADGLDDHERGAVDPGAVGELEDRRVAELHVAGGHLRAVGGGGGGERLVPELPDLVAGHGERALAVRVRERDALQGGVLLDDLAEEVVPCGRRDEGADGPDHAQLEAAVGVERLRYAAAVVAGGGLGGVGGGGRVVSGSPVHLRPAEDDAALQRAPEHGLPPEEHAVVGADVGGGELHAEVADAAEVLEHLSGGVVLLLLRVLARGGGPGSVAVREWLEHGEEHGLEQVGDARARALSQARGVVGRVGGDDAVDAEAGVVDERDERAEAARHGGAPAQGARVGELVEDEEHQRVRHPVEVVLALCREEQVLGEDPVLGLHHLLHTEQSINPLCSAHRLTRAEQMEKRAGVGEAGGRWMDGGGGGQKGLIKRAGPEVESVRPWRAVGVGPPANHTVTDSHFFSTVDEDTLPSCSAPWSFV